MPLYNTTAQEGIDVNAVFIQSAATPEYPAPPFTPGTIAWGTDGSQWVYAQANAATGALAAGSVVIFSPVPGQWLVSPIGGAAVAPFGQLVGVIGGATGLVPIPAVVAPASAAFFWVQVEGNAPNVKSVAAAAKNAQLFSNVANPGSVSSAGGGAGTTYQVNGMVLSQNAGSVAGPNTAILNNPTVGIGA